MRIFATFANRLPLLSHIYSGRDVHFQEVLRGSSVAFVLKVLAGCLGLGFNVLLARRIGAEGTGIFYLALTVIMFATVAGRMGLDNALLRFVAANAAASKWEKVLGVYRKGMVVAAVASAITMLAIMGSADWLSNAIFSKPALATPLRLMAFCVLPLSLSMLYAQLLKGLKRIGNALLVEAVGVPLTSIILLLLLGTEISLNMIALVYVASTVIVLIHGLIAWHAAVPRRAAGHGHFDMRTLLRASTPLFLVASMNLIAGWSSTFILGIWASSESVGIFSMAVRTAAVTSLVLVAVNSIVAPKFAELYDNGDHVALEKLARNVAKLLSLFAAPVLLILVIAPKWVLGLFGSDFTTGGEALTILAVGQFVNVATGSVGYLLMMSGHEKLMRNAVAVSAASNVALSLALVPNFGIIGAAIGTAVSLALMNIIAVVLVYRNLSIMSIPIPDIVWGGVSRGK